MDTNDSDFIDAMRVNKICTDTIHMIFEGKTEDAKNVSDASRILIDTLAEAMQRGSKPSQAHARFNATNEATRRDLAGLMNMFVGVLEQVRQVLAQVGYEQGDGHVETEGCGDPDCTNCHPEKALDIDPAKMKQALAQALGVDPSKIENIEIVSANNAEEAMKKIQNGESTKLNGDSLPSDIRIDDQTRDIQKAIEGLIAPKKKRGQLPS